MSPTASTTASPHAGAGVPQQPRTALQSAGPSSFGPGACSGPRGPVTYGSYLDEVVAYQTTAGGVSQCYCPHYNSLYSVAALTDASGAVAERYTYDAYGKQAITSATGTVRAKSAVGFDRAFTGQIRDIETSLNFVNARMYSPSLGRFVNRDQITTYELGGVWYPGPAMGYQSGMSLYAGYYAPNGLDPSGMVTYLPYEDWIGDAYWKYIGARDWNERIPLGRKCGPCVDCYRTCWDETLVLKKAGDLWMQLRDYEYGITNITLQDYYDAVTGWPGYVAGGAIGAAGTTGAALAQSSAGVAAAAEAMGAGMGASAGVMGGYVGMNTAAASAAGTAAAGTALAGAAGVAGVGLSAFTGATYVMQKLHAVKTKLGTGSMMLQRQMRNERIVSRDTVKSNESTESCTGK